HSAPQTHAQPLLSYTTLFRSHAGERDHLDAPGESLEPELGVRLTTLRVLAGERPDDAPNGDEIPVAEVGHLIDRMARLRPELVLDRKSTRLNSSHRTTSYAVF